MKRLYTLFVILIVLNCFVPIVPAQVRADVDPHLMAAVRVLLGVRPGESIPWGELEAFYDPLYTSKIETLNGLEHATNLKWIDLRHNNELRDITALVGLTHLKVLHLSYNQISDITPLAGLTGLKTLDIWGNQISDITPLAGLTQLKGLSIGRDYITGPAPVDITPLTGLTQLEELHISRLQISEFSPLAELTKLRRLTIGGTQMHDLTDFGQSLTGSTHLRGLLLWRNQISDITPLAELIHLKELDLKENQISDITPLARLINLQVLNLAANQISDLTPLREFTQLKGVNLQCNQISDLTPLRRLTHLKGLNLSFNPINEIKPLTGLTALEWLDLGETQVTTASRRQLRRLPNLTHLRFGGDSLDLYTIDIQSVFDGNFTKAAFVISRQYHCSVEDPVKEQDMSPKDSALQVPVVVEKDGVQLPPMYWINTTSGTINTVMDTEVKNLVPDVQNATSLAVDAAGGKLYWTEKIDNRTGRIRAADLDGSNVVLVKDLTSVPLDITLDVTGSKLYLTNSWGKVQRMNWDGSNFQPNLITGLEAPEHLTLDVARGKIYWTEQTGKNTGKIRRADLSGSNVEMVKELTSVPFGMAVDIVKRKLYVATVDKIQRMNLDGTNFQLNFITGLEAPKALAVAGDKIYWIEGHRIRRASLNGDNIEDAVTGLSSPSSLVLGIPMPSDDMPSPTEGPEPITDTAADVNEDGKVNKADLLLVATALGETSPTNPRVDVNDDGTVAIADLLLVVEDLDDPVVAAAPTITELPTSLNWKALEAHLHLLRISSDGSVSYLQAIAFLEGLLASMHPDETLLLPNYPNPFNPETWIPYQLEKDTNVQLLIYDARGVLIRRLGLGYQPAGYYTSPSRAAYWNGRNNLGERVASGVYFYQLLTNEASSLRKMVILK